jgi:hypothetical protein
MGSFRGSTWAGASARRSSPAIPATGSCSRSLVSFTYIPLMGFDGKALGEKVVRARPVGTLGAETKVSECRPLMMTWTCFCAVQVGRRSALWHPTQFPLQPSCVPAAMTCAFSAMFKSVSHQPCWRDSSPVVKSPQPSLTLVSTGSPIQHHTSPHSACRRILGARGPRGIMSAKA